MSRPAADLTPLLRADPASAVRFGQGRVLAWDSAARTNTVEWRGVHLHNLPVIASTTSMSLGTGDLVALLGWAPAQGPGTWWILGRVIPPGTATTLTGALSFRSDNGIDVATFGGAATADGAPWRLNYSDGRPAVHATATSTGAGAVALLDHTGNRIVATDPAGGLARPSLPIHLVPTAEAETAEGGPAMWPSTAQSDPVPLLVGTTPIWQGRIAISVQTVTSGPTTTARWRLAVDGRTAAEQTGPGEATVPVPGWAGRTPGDPVEVTLSGWATGPGRMWLQATRAHTLGGS
jgi:hypothetical protein